MRTVYIVKGSEDGILGVFGSAKRAANEANRYVQGAGTDISPDYDNATLARKVRKSHFAEATGSNGNGGPCWVSAQIEGFNLR